MLRVLPAFFAALLFIFTGCAGVQYKFAPAPPDARFIPIGSEAIEIADNPEFAYVVLGEIYVTPSKDSAMWREITGRSFSANDLAAGEAARVGATHWIRSMRSVSADYTVQEQTFHAEEFIAVAIRKVEGAGPGVRPEGTSALAYIDSVHEAANPALDKRRADLRAFIAKIDDLTRDDIESFLGQPQRIGEKNGETRYYYEAVFSSAYGHQGKETFSIWTSYDGDQASNLTFSLVPHQVIRNNRLVSTK
jgi:hypothetical protein